MGETLLTVHAPGLPPHESLAESVQEIASELTLLMSLSAQPYSSGTVGLAHL